MAERNIKTAINNNNNQHQADSSKLNALSDVNINAQERLAEILNDSPRIATLAGTEWEVRTLRQGVQWLIAAEVIKINKVEQGAGFGDIIKQFALSMPSVVKVITLAILNDRHKIFIGGDERKGFSELYYATYDTVAWDGNAEEYGNLLLEILQMLDISFFMESHRILEIFRTSTMARKTKMGKQR